MNTIEILFIFQTQLEYAFSWTSPGILTLLERDVFNTSFTIPSLNKYQEALWTMHPKYSAIQTTNDNRESAKTHQQDIAGLLEQLECQYLASETPVENNIFSLFHQL